MKILTITANDNGIGGASRIAMDLHDAYARAGHEVQLLAGKKTSVRTEVSELKRPLWRKALAYLLANDFEFFDGRQVLESAAFRNADIVHCHNLNGWYFNLPVLAEMSRRKPVVWTLHDMWSMTPHSAYTDSRDVKDGLLALSDPSLYPATLWNNDRRLAAGKLKTYRQMRVHLVTPCRWLGEIVAQTALASQGRCVIYNGIETTHFPLVNKAAARALLGLGPEPMVLFVGTSATTNPFKGYVDFEWMAGIGLDREAQFVCLGAQQDGERGGVRLVAATRETDRIAAFMAAADVLVVPSRHEVFPTVMMESASCGTPVVAYDVGGISELLTAAPGCIVVPSKDRESLKQAVEAVLARPAQLSTSISAALSGHIAEGFTLERMASEYLSLFDRLVDLELRVCA